LFFLTLPAFAAVNAGDKGRHGLIGRPRLQLVVRAFRGPALGVRAREVVGGCLHLGFVLVFIPQLLGLNQGNPFVGVHVLVRHECQLMHFDLLGGEHFHDVIISQINAHGAQAVGINLHEITVVPLLHNVFGVRFAQGEIVDSAFQVERRVCSRFFGQPVLQSVLEFIAHILSEFFRICNLQCSDVIRVCRCHDLIACSVCDTCVSCDCLYSIFYEI
jgi:hypothetical protein